MADLAVFAALVGLIGVAGIGLGILAARRIGAWDERRAAAEETPPLGPGSGLAGDIAQPEDGGVARD